MTDAARVGVIMGSDSDWSVMSDAADALAEFDVAYEIGVYSAHRTPQRMLDYARWYYRDLDDCVEWSRYQYLPGPEMRACFLKPVARHPVKVTTVAGLYMAGSTSEGLGAYQDLECEAAMTAAGLVDSERRHLAPAAHDPSV